MLVQQMNRLSELKMKHESKYAPHLAYSRVPPLDQCGVGWVGR
jgi:hypothetical protein